MAGAYVAVARGQEALFTNPANLALDDNPRWSLALPAVALGGTTLGPRFSDFARLALDEGDGDSQEVLDDISESGMETELHLRLPVAALQVGHVALGASYVAAASQTLDRDIVDLLINGYDYGRTDYRADHTHGWRATYLDFAVAYGRRVGALRVGATGHYLRGRTVARGSLGTPSYDGETSLAIGYSETLLRGGSGYSLDVGAAMQPTRRLTLSAAIVNAVGNLAWGEELRERELTLTEEDFDDVVSLADRFQENERPAEDGDGGAGGLQALGQLPTLLRAGAAFAPWSGGRLGTAYERTLGERPMASAWRQSVSVGVQQRLLFLSLRAGYATDLGDATLLSAGASLGPIDLSIGKIESGDTATGRNGWFVTTGVAITGGRAR
jgi:hypothetical protein